MQNLRQSSSIYEIANSLDVCKTERGRGDSKDKSVETKKRDRKHCFKMSRVPNVVVCAFSPGCQKVDVEGL
jgi:hypothetical protein